MAVYPTVSVTPEIRSQVMAEKPVTVRRERVGQIVGRLIVSDVARLNTALAFVMGLAD